MMEAVKAGGDRQTIHEALRVHAREAARVVKVEVGKTTTYHAERLTERGWVRGSAKATQALAEVDVPVKPVETIVRGVVAK